MAQREVHHRGGGADGHPDQGASEGGREGDRHMSREYPSTSKAT